MARNYNTYEYGTSPRKLQPEYTPKIRPKTNKTQNKNVGAYDYAREKKKQEYNKTQNKAIKKQHKKIVLYIGIAFAILFAISYRNSKIDEQFSAVQTLQGRLSTLEKENEQLEVNIENGSNLNNLEQSAKELLGMQKLSNKQSVYVSLPKVDYIEGN